MLSNLLQATATATATATGGVEEVLPHCPYHNQIIFARAAIDAFTLEQGLLDFQEFNIRKNILDRQKAVGVEEFIYREDMRQFWTGIGRLYNVAIDYFHLFNMVRKSNNWRHEWHRAKHIFSEISPMAFGIKAYETYQHVTKLYADAQYEAAGQALINTMLTKQYEMEGNQEWPVLPYVAAYEGEEIAGTVSGMIKAFINMDNTDNLAVCVASQLSEKIDGAVDSLYSRYNADIIDFQTEMSDILSNLDESVENCKDLTKEQVKEMSEQVVSVDEDTVLANLAENKNHIELLMAKMKMQSAMHDYMNFGYSLADVFLTLSANSPLSAV